MKIKPLIAGLVCVLAMAVIFIMVTGSGDPGDQTPDVPGPSVSAETPEAPEDPSGSGQAGDEEYVEYTFRNDRLLEEHFRKHGVEMGFDSEEDYEKAASDVANDPDALHKLEKDDGDDVYYKEETNEFVVISTDGFIRTYFCPDSGKKYFDKQ